MINRSLERETQQGLVERRASWRSLVALIRFNVEDLFSVIREDFSAQVTLTNEILKNNGRVSIWPEKVGFKHNQGKSLS